METALLSYLANPRCHRILMTFFRLSRVYVFSPLAMVISVLKDESHVKDYLMV
jgi:hypothetical protein